MNYLLKNGSLDITERENQALNDTDLESVDLTTCDGRGRLMHAIVLSSAIGADPQDIAALRRVLRKTILPRPRL